MDSGLYKGVSINESFMLSYLFYADDVVFVGEWSDSNINNIIHVLQCFFLALGLKINIHKSKLMGIGVSSIEVDNAAKKWVVRLLQLPSIILVLKLEGLCRGKVRGLKLFASSVHGSRGAFDGTSSASRTSPWLDIIQVLSSLKSKGIDLLGFAKKKSRKDISVVEKFSHSSLAFSFRRLPRGGVEEEQFYNLISCTSACILLQIEDRWVWSLSSTGDFSVNSTCSFIDDKLLPRFDSPTRWVKVIPIKINIFAWRVWLDKLPTRLNLSLIGVDIPSILCSSCNNSVESSSYLFFYCPVTRQVWSKVLRWWELTDSGCNTYDDWLNWLNNSHMSKGIKDIFEGVCYVMWWSLWRFRNQCVFGKSQPRKESLFDDIVQMSFTWCASRCKSNFNWNS
ncbi:RNA-directed DNA polymerase, eukaryota [Tanacetum coccineum]